MNSAPRSLLSLATGALLATAAQAQTPVDPPPWWGVPDTKTVSLYWSFSGPNPLRPTLAIVPAWYQPGVTQLTLSPNLQILPTYAGHTDVVALVQTGVSQSASIDATVDNDPYPDWIKIFSFQYDAFEGAAGDIRAQIAQSLSYKRAIVSETSVPIGGGWQRVTIQAQLIPQPDDEDMDWSFLTTNDTIAIDNLFVSSKCVKPGPDETGDALGTVETKFDLSTLTGGADCQGVAVVEGPPPAFTKSYVVSRRASLPGAQHELLRIVGGSVIATIPLGATPTTAPLGPGDLAVETHTTPGGVVTQQIVWVVLDRRANGQPVLLQGVDVATGTVTSLPLPGFPPPAVVSTNEPLGLAFDPSGEFGAGTFWVSSTDQATNVGTMREFSRSALTPGALIDTRPLPAHCTGLGYDDTLGNFYAFSQDTRPTPSGPIQVNGFEISGYDFQPTGTRFCGDLTIPNGLGGPRGGIAAGFEVYRSRALPTSQLNLVCLVETPNSVPPRRWVYELAGPFGFGWSVLGRCGMRNTGPFGGVPFVGSTMEVTLTGVPNSLLAMMFLGFSNTSAPGIGPLPLNLQPLLGFTESVLSVSPDVSTPLQPPTSTGEFVFPVPIPPAPVLGYAPVFFQWLALDTGIPGGFAMSQAGKTVIYP